MYTSLGGGNMEQKMERLQFYLEPELNKNLDRAARKSGVSKAFLVREGVRRVLAENEIPFDDPLMNLIGGGKSGRNDISERHDRYLIDQKKQRHD